MMSKRILSPIMQTTCIAHAPRLGEPELASGPRLSRKFDETYFGDDEASDATLHALFSFEMAPSSAFIGLDSPASVPLALTQFAFRFGRADWSLMCSIDSGGS